MKKKKKNRSIRIKALLVILLIPVSVTLFTICAILWTSIEKSDLVRKSAATLMDLQDRQNGVKIPEEYIQIYMDAGDEYNIPWTLLAAHHRIETRFSTMDPLISPVGAEGHMQFMPCTFVGWDYPGCSGLGKGNIPEKDKTDPAVIKKYGGYGVDANGDGIADPFDLEDAIFSAANYLAKSGASDGEIEKAIFHYNHSEKYVEDVLWYFNEFEEQRTAAEQRAAN